MNFVLVSESALLADSLSTLLQPLGPEVCSTPPSPSYRHISTCVRFFQPIFSLSLFAVATLRSNGPYDVYFNCGIGGVILEFEVLTRCQHKCSKYEVNILGNFG